MTKQSRKRTADIGESSTEIRLRAKDLATLTRALENPPMPSPALVKLMRHTPPWERKPNFGWPFDNVNAIILKSR
jgi:uncharacterized protein (DUF1778 family)